jgi:PEP-CTERM motif
MFLAYYIEQNLIRAGGNLNSRARKSAENSRGTKMINILKKVTVAMKISLVSLIFTALVWMTGSSTVYAVATLHIGFGAGMLCDVGCGGDPNISPSATNVFDIYQNSGGASLLDQPVLLIIGVPNVTDPNFFSAASITGVSSYNSYTPYPGATGPAVTSNTWTYGATTPKTDITFSGFAGTLDPGEEVYGDVLGLTGNNSQSFTNWTILDPTATVFGIYVFGLNADLGAKGLINITFANTSTVPVGSYIIAYGEDPPPGQTRITTFDTPFTETGYQCCSQVPEPSGLLLLGSGLLGLAFLGRKRLRTIKN